MMNIRKWLLHLYPQTWRQRYEEEFLALLDQRTLSLRDIFDIVLGALDARLHAYIPDPIPTVEKIVPMLKGERNLNRMYFYRNIPSKGQLEITVSYANEQNIGAKVVSVAELRLRESTEGDEVTVKGPEGDMYKFSLAPWANGDAEQTFLHMTFRYTPEYPLQIDPALLAALPFPSSLPNSSELPSIAIPRSETQSQARPLSNKRLPSSFIAHESQGHKIQAHASSQQTGITIRELFALPEIATDRGIACPLCEMILHPGEPWQQFFNRSVTISDGEEARLEVSISHPGNLPETKTSSEDYPFHVQRHWHFTPATMPSTPDLKDLLSRINLSIVIKSHDHFITIQPAPDGTPASALLALPATKQEDIACPLCDTTLRSNEPLAKTIKVLSDAIGEDTTGIEVRISHPQDVTETKTPFADYPFQVQRHEKPLDSEMKRKFSESSPAFVVKPKDEQA